MKNKRIVILAALVLVALGLWIGYARGDIGLSEQAMCRENADYMGDGDVVTCQIGASMACFLHYNVGEDDYDMDIYVKRKGDLGWFFRFGGSSGALDYLMQMNCENNKEYVLCYLSAGSRGDTPEVSRIEVDKGDGSTMTVLPEEGAPFAYVMDHRWNVVVYAEDGTILEPIERSM